MLFERQRRQLRLVGAFRVEQAALRAGSHGFVALARVLQRPRFESHGSKSSAIRRDSTMLRSSLFTIAIGFGVLACQSEETEVFDPINGRDPEEQPSGLGEGGYAGEPEPEG